MMEMILFVIMLRSANRDDISDSIVAFQFQIQAKGLVLIIAISMTSFLPMINLAKFLAYFSHNGLFIGNKNITLLLMKYSTNKSNKMP